MVGLCVPLILVSTAKAHYVPGEHNVYHASLKAWCGGNNVVCSEGVHAYGVASCETPVRQGGHSTCGPPTGSTRASGKWARMRGRRAGRRGGSTRGRRRVQRAAGHVSLAVGGSGSVASGRFVLFEKGEEDIYITSWDTWEECQAAFPIEYPAILRDDDTGREWHAGDPYEWESART
jgi:hypothetical protein